MYSSASPANRIKDRWAKDARRHPNGARKRTMSAYARDVHRRAAETLEETRKKKEKILKKLAKRSAKGLKLPAAEIIRRGRDRR